MRSEFLGTGQNQSDMYVSASVVLVFPSKCEGILKIQEAELREKALYDSMFDADIGKQYPTDDVILHKKSGTFSRDLERNELR